MDKSPDDAFDLTDQPDTFPARERTAREGSEDQGRKPANAAGKESGAEDGDSSGRRKNDTRPARRRLFIFLAVAVAILIAGGGYWYFFARSTISTDDAFIDANIIQIAPQVSGQLDALKVNSNDEVKAGQVLATIDPAGPKAAFAKAQAQMATAQAAVSQAQAGLTEAKAKVAEAQAAQAAAQVKAQNDQRTADRLQSLRKTSGNAAVSQQNLDNAQAQARASAAQERQAKTAVDQAQAGVGAAEAQLASAKAQVQAARAAVSAAQVTLNHLTIKAPADGQVVKVSVSQGSFVQTGQSLMALVPRHIFVTANFKETQIAGIHPGMPVEIDVAAYPNAPLKGTVQSIQRGAGQAFALLPPQNATGNYVSVVQRVPVRISLSNVDLSKYVLGPGMSVTAKVQADSGSNGSSGSGSGSGSGVNGNGSASSAQPAPAKGS